MVDKVALGQGFLRVFRFQSLPVSFHRGSPYSYHPEEEERFRRWLQVGDIDMDNTSMVICNSILLY
jgi:hypothetical protein